MQKQRQLVRATVHVQVIAEFISFHYFCFHFPRDIESQSDTESDTESDEIDSARPCQGVKYMRLEPRRTKETRSNGVCFLETLFYLCTIVFITSVILFIVYREVLLSDTIFATKHSNAARPSIVYFVED